MNRRLLVLGWHNIEPTYAFGGTSPEAGRRGFEYQVRLLRRWAHVVPLYSALADLAEGRPLPPRAVALTFDDGYLDNVTFAAPTLHAAGLPATFFLVPGFLSGTARVWWEDLGRAFVHATAREVTWNGERFDTSSPPALRAAMGRIADSLKRLDSRAREDALAELSGRLLPEGPPSGRKFMDWDEAQLLLTYGHDIGSHTCSHPILSCEPQETQARQLTDSRRELEARFQRPVRALAYPNGRRQDFSEVTEQLALEAGYEFSVTTRNGLAGVHTSPTVIPRVIVDAETDLRAVLRRGAGDVRRTIAARLGHTGPGGAVSP